MWLCSCSVPVMRHAGRCRLLMGIVLRSGGVCVRVNVRFVWGAFVSCCFACGCVLELFVCRVRAGSPNRPQDQAGARWHIALSGGIVSWRDAWCVVIDRPVSLTYKVTFTYQ